MNYSCKSSNGKITLPVALFGRNFEFLNLLFSTKLPKTCQTVENSNSLLAWRNALIHTFIYTPQDDLIKIHERVSFNKTKEKNTEVVCMGVRVCRSKV